ncbi:ANTAR domain-containing response regulator [Spiribacter insolitus]|uniref:ANTAR domain-containing protein n=1 Tax=Spiribacter insolitus TaxID=3122417 RepID=A0ABV3T7K5_9GAMM
MSRRIKNNFRGCQVLIVADDELNCQHLERALFRLGMHAHRCRANELNRMALPALDLVIFDADQEDELASLSELAGEPALIALIGNEAPSRLSRVVALGCDSHITKPIRTLGIYSAVVLAANGRAARAELKKKIAHLNQRILGRKTLIRAVVRLTQYHQIDESDAYDYLRKEAMSRRISIEEAADQYLQMQTSSSDFRVLNEERKE